MHARQDERVFLCPIIRGPWLDTMTNVRSSIKAEGRLKMLDLACKRHRTPGINSEVDLTASLLLDYYELMHAIMRLYELQNSPVGSDQMPILASIFFHTVAIQMLLVGGKRLLLSPTAPPPSNWNSETYILCNRSDGERIIGTSKQPNLSQRASEWGAFWVWDVPWHSPRSSVCSSLP